MTYSRQVQKLENPFSCYVKHNPPQKSEFQIETSERSHDVIATITSMWYWLNTAGHGLIIKRTAASGPQTYRVPEGLRLYMSQLLCGNLINYKVVR